MRVNILTFHCVDNYGAMLQAFALKRKLEQLGHDVRIINFSPWYKTYRYALLPWYPIPDQRNFRNLRFAFQTAKTNFRNRKVFYARKRAMRSFRARRLTEHRPAMRFQWQLHAVRGDMLVLGSDQIWNANLTGARLQAPYFGMVSRHRRVISYAASMGSDRVNTVIYPEFRSLLAHVDAVSLREKSALAFLESFGRKAAVVADPVLLMDMDGWAEVAPSTHRWGDAPYILLYYLSNDGALYDHVDRFSKKTGMRVIDVCNASRTNFCPDFIRVSDAGPEEFLSLMRNASCVITNSFHGTAFSVLFHRPFVAIAKLEGDVRIKDLLGELGLTERIIPSSMVSEEELPIAERIGAPADWSAVDGKRRAMAGLSESFLLEQLALSSAEKARKRPRANSPVLFRKRSECSGCGACVDVCPQQAISLWPDGGGFLYPKIDREKCVGCGRCKAVCPLKEKLSVPMPANCFVAKFPDRALSTSGGAFAALARVVLKRGGIVLGAAWTVDMGVAHRAISDEEELAALRCSKYVQSDCRDAYRRAAEALRAGRWVLFSGTPCQAEAMRRFAGDQPRLLTVSIVCQGVPSPGLWARYVNYLGSKSGGKVTDFHFRDKQNADNGRTTSWRAGDRAFSVPNWKDPYTSLFSRRQILRPSCHACPFATPARATDISIGDAWGIDKIDPEFSDGMGTSLVIPHTQKGHELWEEARANAETAEYPMDALLQNRLRSPSPKGPRRYFALYAWRWMPMSRYLRILRFISDLTPAKFVKAVCRRIRRVLR